MFFVVAVVTLLALWMVATFATKVQCRREILKANRERLGELRRRPDWPQELDAFAQLAAARGG